MSDYLNSWKKSTVTGNAISQRRDRTTVPKSVTSTLELNAYSGIMGQLSRNPAVHNLPGELGELSLAYGQPVSDLSSSPTTVGVARTCLRLFHHPG